ncbi:putative glutathione transferase [Helianthus anomalus]
MTSSGEKKLQLYSYHSSSCSFRFLKLNPIGYVPVLVDGDLVIADSFALIMYLEEKYPQHPLLP